MNKLRNLLLATTFAVATSCVDKDPVLMPVKEDLFKENKYGQTFEERLTINGLLGYWERGMYMRDDNNDGKVDEITYVTSDGFIRPLAYDSINNAHYRNQSDDFWVRKSIQITPSLDSAIVKFMDAAKDLKWKYELEKFYQQKRPR